MEPMRMRCCTACGGYRMTRNPDPRCATCRSRERRHDKIIEQHRARRQQQRARTC